MLDNSVVLNGVDILGINTTSLIVWNDSSVGRVLFWGSKDKEYDICYNDFICKMYFSMKLENI